VTIGDPPPGAVWNDHYGYMPWLDGPGAFLLDPIEFIITYVYPELADDRSALWFWDVS
jgi:hypothetical protein